MSRLNRLLPLACALAFLAGSTALAGAAAHGPVSASAAKKGKRKCPRGYKVKTVTVKRHGKKVKVKRCRKVRGAGSGTTGGGSAPLFAPPGQRLEGQNAVPFLQRYLADSTFTDCPAGWPNCAVEERYSHSGNGSFYYCRLTPTSGSDIRFGSEYEVKNAVVEADGSWTFNELVANGGNTSLYEWQVDTNGRVIGAYQFNGGAPEQLGPFQYVSGTRDCSY
jgi:hypothetical protein